MMHHYHQESCTDEQYQDLSSKVASISIIRYRLWLGENLVMLLAILTLSVMVVRWKKLRSFEIKILLCMFLAYLEGFTYRLDAVFNGGRAYHSVPAIKGFLEATALTLIAFAHWTYASKYMQTCTILPSLLRSAFLLMTQYNEKLQRENDEMNPLTESYCVRHD